MDATVSEGWLDLKVKNNTDLTFQIRISLDESNIYGRIYADRVLEHRYEITNHDKSFFKRDGKTFERVSVCRKATEIISGNMISEDPLYTDVCEIGYSLPEGTAIARE